MFRNKKITHIIKTIHSNYSVDKWSLRLVDALRQIKVLVCPDDTFFRKHVNYKVIEKLSTYIDDTLIGINLEPAFDGIKVNEILTLRKNNKKMVIIYDATTLEQR